MTKSKTITETIEIDDGAPIAIVLSNNALDEQTGRETAGHWRARVILRDRTGREHQARLNVEDVDPELPKGLGALANAAAERLGFR